MGRSYKAAFDGAGAAITPRLGADVPRNFPARFHSLSASAGGRALACDAAVAPQRAGDVVSFRRGALTESYRLHPGGVEQLFVLDRGPARGEVVIAFAIESELAVEPADGGYALRGPFGGLRVGAAFLVSGDGERLTLEQRVRGDRVEIVVPAALADAVEGPLTIDPEITTLSFTTTPDATYYPDVAYVAGTSRYAVVWEHAYSATDGDIWLELRDTAGAPVANSGAFIDQTTANWRKPRVASNRVATQFLVVAEVGPAGQRSIWGRRREAELPVSMSAVFEVSAGTGDKTHPDVGGDPHPSPPTWYCVVWQRASSAADGDIHYRMVAADGTMGTTTVVAGGSEDDQKPRISKSDGNPPATTQRWTVVWERHAGAQTHIYASQFDYHGVLTYGEFPAILGYGHNMVPSVSSVSDDQNGHRSYLVTAQRNAGAVGDTLPVAIMEGNQAVAWTHGLHLLEGEPERDRRTPVADCDGTTFTVVYTEQFGSGQDHDVHMTSLRPIGGQAIGVSEARAPLTVSAGTSSSPAMAFARSGGGTGRNALVAWHEYAGSDPNVLGSLMQSPAPVPGHVAFPTAYGDLGICARGVPAIGQPVAYTVLNASGASLIALGIPMAPAAVCGPILVGLDLYASPVFVPGPVFAGVIPSDPNLVGLSVAVQAGDLGGSALVCGGLRVTDAVLVTIQ